jgi:hypothetical protein
MSESHQVEDVDEEVNEVLSLLSIDQSFPFDLVLLLLALGSLLISRLEIPMVGMRLTSEEPRFLNFLFNSNNSNMSRL